MQIELSADLNVSEAWDQVSKASLVDPDDGPGPVNNIGEGQHPAVAGHDWYTAVLKRLQEAIGAKASAAWHQTEARLLEQLGVVVRVVGRVVRVTPLVFHVLPVRAVLARREHDHVTAFACQVVDGVARLRAHPCQIALALSRFIYSILFKPPNQKYCI